ncbi:hypothetical protein CLV30_10144 [Haloactinopolyspora alba]|uniref:Integral membrane protein n=1 Tax=Haloactinopolyspora alba TaxID=648780 RepID=A0A2P8EF45_9ACTN|nr:hypothetical protein [Haloactinopolyspora alba]PSL08077.1 hypothetical protein CLV30_10144 [Haloactinopolyspora alba]
MTGWFEQAIVSTGRLPLFAFFVSVIAGFVIARISTRLIRANVRWWSRNVVVGDVHVHHAVLGIILMLISGVTGLALPAELVGWRTAAAAVFGLGAAAVLDEFALILRLRDVYWTAEGRISVDAVFIAVAITGLVLLGMRPAGLDDFVAAAGGGTVDEWIVAVALTAVNLTLATVTMLKGKVPTGLFGMFAWPVLAVGAARLARPTSPWARWRYHRPGPRPAHKLERAVRREHRIHRPLRRVVTTAGDLIAGRPSP